MGGKKKKGGKKPSADAVADEAGSTIQTTSESDSGLGQTSEVDDAAALDEGIDAEKVMETDGGPAETRDGDGKEAGSGMNAPGTLDPPGSVCVVGGQGQVNQVSSCCCAGLFFALAALFLY